MMESHEKEFILAQLRAIHLYLQQHRGENPEGVTMQWIERYAADYRKQWEAQHII